MGLFNFLSPLTPQSASERIVASSVVTDLSAAETNVAAAIGVGPHLLVKERIVFRLAFSLASVAFFHNEVPDRRVNELYECLDSRAFRYLFTLPGVSEDHAGQLWAQARSDYFVRKPHELAGVMMARLFQYEDGRTSSPEALQLFLEMVHSYARDSMTQAGELAKKLRVA